jgi:hypothetical protein
MDRRAFWHELHAARAAAAPRSWRRPLDEAVAGSAELLHFLLDAGGARLPLRVFGDGRELAPAASHLPRREDGDVAGWCRRLAAAHGEVGLVVNDVQASSPESWRALGGLVAGLYEVLGPQPGGASMDLFAGGYRRGAFGVHKDDQDVVTFIVEGKKSFLLWPYPRFAAPAGSELRQHGLPGVCASAERGDAILLEGEAGDVFFWPAEWWHVAVGDGAHATTLGLGLFRGEPPRRDRDEALAFASTLGFNRAPAPAPRPLPRGPVALALRGGLPIEVEDEDVLWAVAGSVFRYPAAAAIVRLLERVAGGEPFVPGRLVAELADAEVAPDALEHILGVLAAHHAICIAGATPGGERRDRRAAGWTGETEAITVI